MQGGHVDFTALQLSLVERLRRAGFAALESGTIFVLPSISFPDFELRKIIGIEYYEERMLFMLLYLRDPNVRIVYATSMPVDADVIDYYLSFLPDPASARARLATVDLGDPEPRALTEKLLDRPDVLGRIKDLIPDRSDAYILPFNVTELERSLAEKIGVPVYGPPPELVWLGSKSGAREVADAAGVPVLPGAGNLHSIAEVEAALASLRDSPFGARSAVIKLNNGFSGQGNAIVALDARTAPLDDSNTAFCASEETWASFGPKIADQGAIVEAHLSDPGVVSPSVQLRTAPSGDVELVSTHDQILGGPDRQVYLGCRFPAAERYRSDIQERGVAVARVLAERGVLGSFGVDLVIDPGGGIYLSEINLRLGGTTHPFLMARLLTRGTYEQASGTLVAGGKPKSYVSSDNLKAPAYKALRPGQVIAALRDKGLAFDPATGTGVTVHLLGALPGYGKMGILAVGDSPEDAERSYDWAVALMDELVSASA